jgi:putative two-component system response regulator
MNDRLFNDNEIKELIDSRESFIKQSLAYAKDLKKTFIDLKAAHQELHEAYLDTIQRLAVAAESRDEDTGEHIQRIRRYSSLLAEKTGMDKKNIETILYAAPMHDVGKIGVPDSILMKKGKLSEEEFGIMKTHTVIGAKILTNSKSRILQVAESIAMTHHEKWNGKGYPQGISGNDIPLEGRIVALADVFDALTSNRPYKEPFLVEKTCDIIKDESGKHFDPELVALFFENLDIILDEKETLDVTKHFS